MTTTDYDAEGYADFSDERKPVRFSAQGERYECYPAISAGTTQKVIHAADGLDPEDAIGMLSVFFHLVMPQDDADRLMRQMDAQAHNALTVDQGVKIMHFVMERYGLRPLDRSSD